MELRIKEVQKKKGISNIELARLTKIGSQQITNYHTGFRAAPLTSLQKIASALDCEVAELLSVGPGFAHFYDENGIWQGIRRK